MKVYVVGYGSCEESEYEYLLHDDTIDKDELEAFVHECVLDAIDYKIEADEYIHTYQDIHDYVIDALVNEYRFKRLEVEAEWACFGWASLFTKDDWQSYRGETDNKLVDRVNEAGYTVENDSFLNRK
jgi:hypothetical protein